MPRWLSLFLSPIGSLLRRAFQPADLAIIDRYRDELSHIEERYQKLENRLNECEARHQDCEDQTLQLRMEVANLRQNIIQFQHTHLIGRITINKDNVIIDANEDAAIICETTIEKLLNQQLWKIIPHRYRDRHDVSMKQVIDGEKVLRATIMDLFLLTGTGHEVPVSISLSSWGVGEKIQFSAEMRRR